MPWYRFIIPTLIATVTNRPRSLVDFQWSQSIVYNTFRVWELIAGRRCSSKDSNDTIRFESSTSYVSYKGKTYLYRQFGTWESILCFIEGIILQFFKNFQFKMYQIPEFSFASIGPSPHVGAYRFAIAFDAAAGNKDNGGLATSISWTHVTTGTNTYMVGNGAFNAANGTVADASSYTYNSIGLTARQNQTSATDVRSVLFDLTAPTTGSNTAVFTITTPLVGGGQQLMGETCTYSGAAQSGQPDSSNKNSQTGTQANFPVSTTVVVANCWISGNGTENAGDIAGGSPGAGTTYRGVAQFNMFAADSNGTVATGSQTLNYGRAGSNGAQAGCTLSIAPTGGAAVARPIPFLNLMGVGA